MLLSRKPLPPLMRTLSRRCLALADLGRFSWFRNGNGANIGANFCSLDKCRQRFFTHLDLPAAAKPQPLQLSRQNKLPRGGVVHSQPNGDVFEIEQYEWR